MSKKKLTIKLIYGKVKHFSNRKKRNQESFILVVASEY